MPVSRLIAIFLFCILLCFQQFCLGVQPSVNARLTGNPNVIPIPNIAKQIDRVRGDSFVDLCPPRIVRNSGVQGKFEVLSFSRSQYSLANPLVGTVFQFHFISRIIESSTKHMDVTANNECWSSPDINDLKGHNASDRLTKRPIPHVVAESYDPSVANNDFRSVLQNDRGVLKFRSDPHLSKLALHQVRLTPDRVEAAAHNNALMHHLSGLPSQETESTKSYNNTAYPNNCQNNVHPKSGNFITVFVGGFDDPYICANVLLGFIMWGWGFCLLYLRCSNWWGWLFIVLSLSLWARLGVSVQNDEQYRRCHQAVQFHHDVKIVPHKYIDTL